MRMNSALPTLPYLVISTAVDHFLSCLQRLNLLLSNKALCACRFVHLFGCRCQDPPLIDLSCTELAYKFVKAGEFTKDFCRDGRQPCTNQANFSTNVTTIYQLCQLTHNSRIYLLFFVQIVLSLRNSRIKVSCQI